MFWELVGWKQIEKQMESEAQNNWNSWLVRPEKDWNLRHRSNSHIRSITSIFGQVHLLDDMYVASIWFKSPKRRASVFAGLFSRLSNLYYFWNILSDKRYCHSLLTLPALFLNHPSVYLGIKCAIALSY
jgi:hypothetical protein